MIDSAKIAKIINDLRIFPRLMMVSYGAFLYYVVNWALEKDTISTQHAAIISSVVAIASLLVPSYMTSGGSANKKS